MKKALLITLFIIALSNITLESKAQPYRPMAVEGAHWIVKADDVIGFTTRLFEYYCSGDTVVNDIQYKKIYYRDLAPTMDPPPFYPISEYSLFAFLRDDTVNRKVYAYTLEMPLFGSCDVAEEVLLYDFSVQPGQPVVQCTFPSFYEGTLDTIVVETWFGISTRVFYTYPMNFRYYEGIGSEFGLFEAMFIPVKGEDFEYPSLYYYCEGDPCEYVYPEMTLMTVGEVFDFQPGDEFYVKPDPTLCATLINGYDLIVGPGFEDDNIIREYGRGLGVTKDYMYSGIGGAVQYSQKLVFYYKSGVYCGEMDVTSTGNIAKSHQRHSHLYPLFSPRQCSGIRTSHRRYQHPQYRQPLTRNLSPACVYQ